MENHDGLTRRSFLKGAGVGAVAGAAAVVGAGNVLNSKNEAQAAIGVQSVTPYEKYIKGRMYARSDTCKGATGYIAFEDGDITPAETNNDYDVIVVGGGMTGVMAALTVASQNVKVCILEKMTAGRGMFEDIGTLGAEVQKQWGITTTTQEKVEYIRRLYESADGRLRRGAVHTFVEYSGRAVDFLADELPYGKLGLTLTAFTNAMGGTDPRDHRQAINFVFPSNLQIGGAPGRGGMNVVRDLTYAGRNHYPDYFYIKLDTPVVQLVRPNNEGAVTGVIAKENGKYVQYNAKSVVLATGGYSANPDLMAAWCRSEDYSVGAFWDGSFGITGDGHMMGLRAGGLMDEAPHAVMTFAGTCAPFTHGFRNNLGMQNKIKGAGWFWVSSNGKRFTDEDNGSTGGGETSHAVNGVGAQENLGKNVWMIGQAPAAGATTGAEFRDGDYVEGTLDEIAEKCGINKENLEKTITNWNRYCTEPDAEDGLYYDKEFGRDLSTAPKRKTLDASSKLAALKQAGGYLLTTVSGLQVDEDFHVIDAKTEKGIEGLYAGGNASGCFFDGYYPRSVTGVSMGRAVTSGYVIGMAACSANGKVDHEL